MQIGRWAGGDELRIEKQRMRIVARECFVGGEAGLRHRFPLPLAAAVSARGEIDVVVHGVPAVSRIRIAHQEVLRARIEDVVGESAIGHIELQFEFTVPLRQCVVFEKRVIGEGAVLRPPDRIVVAAGGNASRQNGE